MHIFVSVTVVWLSLLGTTTHAQTLDPMQVERFESDITVREDATIRVVETVYVNFEAPRHGLLRTIPVQYDAGLTQQSIGLTVVDVTANGQSTAFTASMTDGSVTVKIGEPDAFVEGKIVYELTYDVNRVFLYHDLTDELYWNVTGDAWESGIPETEVTVHVLGVDREQLDVSCYVGRYGSTDQTCTKSIDDGTVRVFAPDFLTVSVSFSKDVIHEPGTRQTLLWWLQDNWTYVFLIVPLLVVSGMYQHWKKHGKDAKGRGTIMAEYEPPEGMRPTEVGTLTDAQLHDRDFAAGIVDLAVRGYLKIVEEEGVSGFGKKYKLEQVKSSDEVLKLYEKSLLDTVFGNDKVVSLTRGAKSLVAARKLVETQVYESMASDGYFVENPTSVRTKYVAAGVILAFVTHVVVTASAAAGQVLFPLYVAGVGSGIIVGLFGMFMPKRTPKGTEASDKADGFKRYLSQAEEYRLRWQEEENVFEKFLPFAMAFGVVDKWTKAVGSTIESSPAWFVGVHAFDVSGFGDRMTSVSSALTSAVAPAKSGGSGGGGFSGGGFGGGGGGSW